MAASHPALNIVEAPNDSFINRLFDNGYNAFNSAISQLNLMANEAVPPLNLADTVPETFDPSSITFGTLPSAPVKPDLLSVPIDEFPVRPILTTDTLASDTILSNAIARIISEITYRFDNPTGLKANVETAIWSRGVDRAAKMAGNAYNRYLASTSARGFKRATGQDIAAKAFFDTQSVQEISGINRDIMIKQAELEQGNIQQTLSLFQQFQAQLFSEKNNDESRKVQLYGVDIDRVLKKAQLYIDVNNAYVSIYNAEIQAYVGLVGAESEKGKLQLEKASAINNLNIQLSQLYIERMKLKNESNMAIYNSKIEAMKGFAAVLAQLAGTLFNAVNISESFSYGKSWGYSESVST